jgi:hypothetical protein
VDPAVVSSIDTILQGAGFLGAAILALGWFCLKKDKDLQQSQEKRVEDAKKYAEGMAQAASTIKELTNAVNRIADMWDGKSR